MKLKKSVIITVLAVFLTLSALVFSVFAEETPYAGSDLPVSESYVLRAIGVLEERIYNKIDTMIEALSERLDAIEENLDAKTENTAPVTASVDYTVIYVEKGQSVVGNCEIILRSGNAAALCPGANGLSDLTAGADIMDGTEIDANHLLLVPRNDGRGITVTSDAAYVMVRGTYQIIDPAN
ncbi:MAG: hypothetical protein IKZ09_06295 [Clostridia bacterium]|nr:hypothetical protein [Clostridia bacterium]